MEGLPRCDGSNGVVGLDCQSAWGYPKKTAGRPWAPMNDAYPAGFPRYASRAQMRGDEPEPKNNTTEEDDAEKITPLPDCNGKNGVKGVDCKKPKLKQLCPGNQEPKVQEGVENDCRIMKWCDKNPGMVPGLGAGDCYSATASLAQHMDKPDNAKDDGNTRNATTEEDDTAKEAPLPACNGSNGIAGVDCKKAKLKKLCTGNQMPKEQDGVENDCRVMKWCDKNPGMSAGLGAGDCYKPGSSLVQLESHHKHHHHHRH